MDAKQCSACQQVLPAELFGKVGRVCQPCKNARQRVRRAIVGNVDTHKYEKTKSGFLMRAYRNMQSRVTGVQWQKYHLYAGKTLLEREEFYQWSLAEQDFHRLFEAWTIAEYDQRLTPSVDRIKSELGYEIGNIRWITHSENSRLGSISQRRTR